MTMFPKTERQIIDEFIDKMSKRYPEGYLMDYPDKRVVDVFPKIYSEKNPYQFSYDYILNPTE